MKKALFIIAITIIFLPALKVHAQDSIPRRIIGISGTIQTTQFGIMAPVFICKRVSVAPAVDFAWAEKQGIDYSIGLVPKIYLQTRKLAPYVSLRGAMAVYIPDRENTLQKRTTDWIAGVAFGTEYFLDPRFSFGVEIQGNLTKSDDRSFRFNNPGNWTFNLGTMVSANIFFLKK
ncbi:MAG: hypothetical protein FJY10_05055 [Bacteroidetes bacterium]|nr:hypothetical protein [Bacteroidota bacterium]